MVSKRSIVKSFRAWITIGMKMLPLEERQEMLTPFQVSRPIKRPGAINRSIIAHHNSRKVLTCSDPHERRIVGIDTQKLDITRNMPGCVMSRIIVIPSPTLGRPYHLLYSEATAWPFRERNQPILQCFGFRLKPPIGKKLARARKNLF